MPIYKVRATAEVTYEATIKADDEDMVKSDIVYCDLASGPATDHAWQDTEIVEQYEDDDPNAPEPDLEY